MKAEPDYKAICEEIWDDLKPLGIGRGPYFQSMPKNVRKLVARYQAQEKALDEIRQIVTPSQ